MTQPTSNASTGKFQWHHFYYVLAVFDIVSVCITLALGHAIMAIYLDSVHTNAAWVERVHAFNKIGTLASKLNEPGNDLFKSRNVQQEKVRLAGAKTVFNEHFETVKRDVETQIKSPDREELLKHLAEIQKRSLGIIREAELVFESFQNKAEEAGSHMADMDTEYAQLLSALTDLTQRVSTIQTVQFKSQVKDAENLKRFEYMIVVFIILMVCAVAVYGHKLGAKMIQTSENLRQSEARFRALSEAFPQVVFEATELGEITFLNRAGQKMLNLDDAKGVEGLNIVDFAIKEERYKVFEWLRHWQPENRVNGIEIQVDSSQISNGIMYCNRFSNASSGNFFTGLLVDISDQKILENELREAKQVADSNSEAKSEFLAKMSHELRTPIGGILGMLDILLRKGLDPEQQDYAQTAYNSAESLLTLINDILDFSKIEAGKLEIETIDFNLRTVVEEVSDLLSLKASQKNLDFIVDLPPKTPVLLKGDPTRTRQILINLLNNAIKFTNAGEVLLKITEESGDDSRASLLLEVTDTGIGISKSIQASLFESFQQAEKATSRQFGGTGLGLSICKELSELMGGTIGVRSEVGVGSTFWVKITFDLQKNARNQSAKSQFSMLRVLVVDSSRTSRILLQNYVEAWGCICETAINSDQALSKLRTAKSNDSPFNLVLLDGDLLDGNSISLAKAIDNDTAINDVQKILLSANKEALTEIEEAKELFVALVPKPIKQSQLLDALALNSHDIEKAVSGSNSPQTKIIESQGLYADVDVLLAEDNRANQKLITHLLNELGIRKVTLVTTGREATAKSSLKRFDLILLDGVMPEMSGSEAARSIRQEGENTKTPIIALTAESMQRDRDRFFEAGVTDYLCKPFKSNDFFRVVQKQLNKLQAAKSRLFQALIVDDNSINRKILQSYLDNIGGSCSLAEDGEQAIALIQNKDFDLILLDCHMPRKNGYETARWIRNWEKGRSRLPIVAVTADISQGNKEKCLEAGMDEFVTKPIQPQTLINVVQKILNLKLKNERAVTSETLDQSFFSSSTIQTVSFGNKDFERDFLGTAIDDIRDYQKTLQQQLDQELWTEAGKTLHSIAGVSGNVGATRLSEASQSCESLIKQEKTSELLEGLPDYLAIMTVSCDAMVAYLDSLKE